MFFINIHNISGDDNIVANIISTTPNATDNQYDPNTSRALTSTYDIFQLGRNIPTILVPHKLIFYRCIF